MFLKEKLRNLVSQLSDDEVDEQLENIFEWAKIYKDMADTYPEAAYQLGLMYKRGVLSSPFMPDYHQAARYLQQDYEA